MKKIKKIQNKWIFISIQGVHAGGHPGGSRTHSGAEKHKKIYFFIFLNFFEPELVGTGTGRNRTDPNRTRGSLNIEKMYVFDDDDDDDDDSPP